MISKPRKKKITKKNSVKRNPDDDIVTIYSISKIKLGKTKAKIDYLLSQMFRGAIIDNIIRSYENGKWITFYTKDPLTGNQVYAYEKIIRGLIELESIETTNSN